LTIDHFSHLPPLYLIRGRGISLKFGGFPILSFLYLIRGRGISLKFGDFPILSFLYLIRGRGISLKFRDFPPNFNLVLLILATKLHEGTRRQMTGTVETPFNEKLLEVQKPFLEKVSGRRRQKRIRMGGSIVFRVLYYAHSRNKPGFCRVRTKCFKVLRSA